MGASSPLAYRQRVLQAAGGANVGERSSERADLDRHPLEQSDLEGWPEGPKSAEPGQGVSIVR